VRQIQRVKREPRSIVVAMPQDRWRGRIFYEADGTMLESLWSGRGPLPGEKPWPVGVEKDRNVPARIHLPKGRS